MKKKKKSHEKFRIDLPTNDREEYCYTISLFPSFLFSVLRHFVSFLFFFNVSLRLDIRTRTDLKYTRVFFVWIILVSRYVKSNKSLQVSVIIIRYICMETGSRCSRISRVRELRVSLYKISRINCPYMFVIMAPSDIRYHVSSLDRARRSLSVRAFRPP